MKADQKIMWHHLTNHTPYETMAPIMMFEGKIMCLTDAQVSEYLDAASGSLWTVNVDDVRKTIAQAVHDQLLKINFYSRGTANLPLHCFPKSCLKKMLGMNRVYHSNSGSEANKKAYKIVLQIEHLNACVV